MKKLSTVCDNILTTAKETECKAVQQRYLLTSEDLTMIMNARNACRAELPEQEAINAMASLKQLANLSTTPTFLTMVNYTKYGCEFVPCDISIPDMNEEQKEICREFVKRLCAPIQKEEFIKRIAKLRYLTANIPDDSESWKLRVAAYYDELSKYPASVVRYALTQTFKFFPTFAEIKEICDFECYRHNLLKRKFCND